MNELVEKYFREELDASERLRLLKTIESDPELKEQFIEYKNMFGLLAFSGYPGNEEESKKGYSRLYRKIEEMEDLPHCPANNIIGRCCRYIDRGNLLDYGTQYG